MNTQNRPVLKPIKAGEAFKILQINGKAGMKMPLHHSTKEAVVIVQEGTAILSMEGKEYTLGTGDHFVIPANKVHSLLLKTAFEALAVMLPDSKIEFEQ